jgi:hypothetical protein
MAFLCTRARMCLFQERCFWRFSLVGFCCRPAVFEGDGECVQSRLPAHGSSCSFLVCGVEATGDKVEAFQGGLLGGKSYLSSAFS